MNQLSNIVGMLNQVKANALSDGSTTDNVPEGSHNLYFTAARGRSLLSAISPIIYNPTTGEISVSGYTGSVIVVDSVDFTAKTVTTKTLTYSNGILTGVS